MSVHILDNKVTEFLHLKFPILKQLHQDDLYCICYKWKSQFTLNWMFINHLVLKQFLFNPPLPLRVTYIDSNDYSSFIMIKILTKETVVLISNLHLFHSTGGYCMIYNAFFVFINALSHTIYKFLLFPFLEYCFPYTLILLMIFFLLPPQNILKIQSFSLDTLRSELYWHFTPE